MTRTVDAYLSVQSPYCYVVMSRLRRLDRHPDVAVRVRPVRPGVLRLPEAYADRGAAEQAYFARDVARTAAFLGLDYAEPDPSPVAFEPGSLWRAAARQPHIDRLLDLLMAGSEIGDGLALFEAVMRLIWGGGTRGWDRGDHLQAAFDAAGVDWHAASRRATSDAERLRAALHANDRALLAAGHWGVPCFVVDDEPFYGQDRFDQLLWRLGIAADDLPA